MEIPLELPVSRVQRVKHRVRFCPPDPPDSPFVQPRATDRGNSMVRKSWLNGYRSQLRWKGGMRGLNEGPKPGRAGLLLRNKNLGV
jgi:hypothetical protein